MSILIYCVTEAFEVNYRRSSKPIQKMRFNGAKLLILALFSVAVTKANNEEMKNAADTLKVSTQRITAEHTYVKTEWCDYQTFAEYLFDSNMFCAQVCSQTQPIGVCRGFIWIGATGLCGLVNMEARCDTMGRVCAGSGDFYLRSEDVYVDSNVWRESILADMKVFPFTGKPTKFVILNNTAAQAVYTINNDAVMVAAKYGEGRVLAAPKAEITGMERIPSVMKWLTNGKCMSPSRIIYNTNAIDSQTNGYILYWTPRQNYTLSKVLNFVSSGKWALIISCTCWGVMHFTGPVMKNFGFCPTSDASLPILSNPEISNITGLLASNNGTCA